MATIFTYIHNEDGVTCTVTGIGTFEGEKLNIPPEIDGYKVTRIDEEAFRRYSSLASVTIPDSVTYIGICAFQDCTGLTSVTIGNSVTSIDDQAFDGCSSLKSVLIPDGVTEIGDWAFAGCRNLKNITIPDSVTYIGSNIFAGCNSLTNITISNKKIKIERRTKMKEYLIELAKVLGANIDNNDMTEDEALEIIDTIIEASRR